MTVTVPDVMREVRNGFHRSVMSGDWRLRDGRLSPGGMLLEGDWIDIRCGGRSDGIHRVGEDGLLDGGGLADEDMAGDVWILRPPPEFLALCAEIADWAARNSLDAVESERFGAFSQKRALGRGGLPHDWPAVFGLRLMPYRRMFGEVTPDC